MCRVCAVGEDAHPTSEWKIGNSHSDKTLKRVVDDGKRKVYYRRERARCSTRMCGIDKCRQVGAVAKL